MKQRYSKEGLLQRLPKKYYERVADLYEEGGLIDDCKFIVVLSKSYQFEDGGREYPCRSYKEAIYFIKNSCSKVLNGIEKGV